LANGKRKAPVLSVIDFRYFIKVLHPIQ